MSKCSGNVRTICGLAAAAAIIVACPARAENCLLTPDLGATPAPALALGQVTSAANRVHFVKNAWDQIGCPSRAPACAKPDYLVPGDRVIISKRRDAFICATYIDAKGVDRSAWLPADAVADDKAEPIALADWLGQWRHSTDNHDGFPYDEGEFTVKAGEAGTLRIQGVALNNKVPVGVIPPNESGFASIKNDVTPAGDRLRFTSDGCVVWMRRLGPWLIVSDDDLCGGDYKSATFRGVYTRRP